MRPHFEIGFNFLLLLARAHEKADGIIRHMIERQDACESCSPWMLAAVRPSKVQNLRLSDKERAKGMRLLVDRVAAAVDGVDTVAGSDLERVWTRATALRDSLAHASNIFLHEGRLRVDKFPATPNKPSFHFDLSPDELHAYLQDAKWLGDVCDWVNQELGISETLESVDGKWEPRPYPVPSARPPGGIDDIPLRK